MRTPLDSRLQLTVLGGSVGSESELHCSVGSESELHCSVGSESELHCSELHCSVESELHCAQAALKSSTADPTNNRLC